MTLAVWLVARICLVAMFPFSAAEKVWRWKPNLAMTAASGLPGAPAMLVAAILVEGLTPFLIVSGWFDRPAAFVLAGFCAVTAFLYHPFWNYRDLWIMSDDSKGREHFWQFLKNFCIVGGLMLVIFAGSLASPGSILAARSWSSPRPSAAGAAAATP